MENDVYKTPESNLVNESGTNEESPIASRWSRLGASIIDTIIIMIFAFPLMYFTGGFDDVKTGTEPSWQYSLILGIAVFIFFFIINFHLLRKYGQTIGKKALGIKIVDKDFKLPTMQNHLLPRYAVYFLAGQIPIIGQLFSFIDVLFIFGKEKRCLHDYIASTRVVVN